VLETIARLLVYGAEIYLGLGLVFAIPFAFVGAGRIDPAARAGTVGFRLLIVPASAALWPLLLRRWLKGMPPPEERNAHRDAAARAARS
jgi:hypothetical protein